MCDVVTYRICALIALDSPCPAGTAQPLVAQLSCNSCGAGSVASPSGQAVCAVCPYGMAVPLF